MLRGWSSALVLSMEGMQGWGKVRVPRAPAQQNCCESALASSPFWAQPAWSPLSRSKNAAAPGQEQGRIARLRSESPFKGFVGFFLPACCSYKQKNKKMFVVFFTA